MSLEKPGSMMGQSSTCSNLHPLQPVYNLFDSWCSHVEEYVARWAPCVWGKHVSSMVALLHHCLPSGSYNSQLPASKGPMEFSTSLCQQSLQRCPDPPLEVHWHLIHPSSHTLEWLAVAGLWKRCCLSLRLWSQAIAAAALHTCSQARICWDDKALFSPKTSMLIQKRHPYPENPNSQASGTSKTRFYIAEMMKEEDQNKGRGSWKRKDKHRQQGCSSLC